MSRKGSISPTPRASAVAVLAFGLFLDTAAGAASLQKVNQSDWWAGVSGLPSYVNMYTYVPGQLASKPPVVVAPHHCQGTAQSTYSEMASLVSIADKTGFILVFPEATGENCWDAGSMRSLTHGGGGDTGAIVQMVKYTLSKYGGDAGRVYTVGGSSGGIMTEALLGVYPDVFMAGVSLMGVPCGCWADGYNDVTGTGSTAQWSANCANGDVSMTGQAWGQLVRSYYPGYTGHRPRLQHWHGTADTTLNFKNLAEDVKEWTNLLGLSETPTGSDTPQSGTAHQFWKNACGYTVYETFALSGVGHAVPFDGNAVAAYFGLDTATMSDPETAACGGGTGGTGGAGSGAGGMAGRSAGGAGGVAPNGGRGDGGGVTGASGMNNAAGAPSNGGGIGMSSGGAGPSRGGSGGTAAVANFGGQPAMTGGGGNGGANQPNVAGATSGGTSGQPGAAGATAFGGTSSAGATSDGMKPASNGTAGAGCNCVIGDHAADSRSALVALVFAALGVARRRRTGKASRSG